VSRSPNLPEALAMARVLKRENEDLKSENEILRKDRDDLRARLQVLEEIKKGKWYAIPD
jgi:hypothetical protein